MFPGLRASVGHPDQAPWRARGGASSAAPDIDHSNREGRNETGDGNPGMSAIRSPTSPYRTCSKGQLSAHFEGPEIALFITVTLRIQSDHDLRWHLLLGGVLANTLDNPPETREPLRRPSRPPRHRPKL